MAIGGPLLISRGGQKTEMPKSDIWQKLFIFPSSIIFEKIESVFFIPAAQREPFQKAVTTFSRL